MDDVIALKRCPCPEHEGENLLPVGEFNRNRSRPDGLESWCRACTIRAACRRRAADPDKVREKTRRWKQSNPEKAREASHRWAQANPEKVRAQGRRWRAANPEKAREQGRRRVIRLRDQVFDHYGRVCTCCGAAENLSIDHVNGGGRKHLIELFGYDNPCGTEFYRWLVKNNFPPGFQTLCLPCNSSKKDGVACRLEHRAA